jgi:hypothetical protein
VEALSIMFWVFGGLCLVGSLLFAAVGVLGYLGVIRPEEATQDRLAGLLGAALIAIPLILLGAAHIVGGLGLRRRQPWGRTTGLVLGFVDILLCCLFPLGTGLGIYTLVLLFERNVAQSFEPGRPS